MTAMSEKQQQAVQALQASRREGVTLTAAWSPSRDGPELSKLA